MALLISLQPHGYYTDTSNDFQKFDARLDARACARSCFKPWPATPTRRVKTECVKSENCTPCSRTKRPRSEMDYIAVMEEGGEPVEVELEEDHTVTLSTLSNEFGSGISGLSYRNPKTGLRRVLRISGDGTRVNPSRDGWSSELTYVVSRVKREGNGVPVEKVTPSENQMSVKKEVTDTETKATAACSGLLQPVLCFFSVARQLQHAV